MSRSYAINESLALAFSLGSDARIAGKGLEANPYRLWDVRGEGESWIRGWRDVEENWGTWSRKPFMLLKEVMPC